MTKSVKWLSVAGGVGGGGVSAFKMFVSCEN